MTPTDLVQEPEIRPTRAPVTPTGLVPAPEPEIQSDAAWGLPVSGSNPVLQSPRFREALAHLMTEFGVTPAGRLPV